MSANEMTGKVQELKELKAMRDELDAEIAAIEDTIKAEMTARNTEEIICGCFKIRWAMVSSTRFDSTGFKKAMPELYARFTKATATRRFTVA